MMVLVRAVGASLLVVGAGFCLAAEEEETPQTGTIEVEVVYKDTGEPVEDVLVFVARDDSRVCADVVSEGRLSVPVGAVVPGSTYAVVIGHVPAHVTWADARSSTFIGHYPRPLQEVEFAPGDDVATVRFEVERGRRLRGTVRRRDGSALKDGIVCVVQREPSDYVWAFGVTDADGRFDMLGIAPAERAEVVVAAALSSDFVGSAPLVRRSVALSGDCTSVDFEVDTVTVDLTLEVCRPLWPFPRRAPDSTCAGHVWAGTVSKDETGQGDVIVFPYGLQPKRRSLGVKRYELSLGEFPARATITTLVGFRRPGEGSCLPPNLSWCSWRTVTLGTGHETIRLRAYEPYARLSRALWFGALPVLVLVVFGTILVKQMRKRRPKETAT